MLLLVCQICGMCNLHSISVLLTHIRVTHSNEADFSIRCNLQGCQRTFKNFNTFRNHIYNFHDSTEVNATEVHQYNTVDEDLDDCVDIEDCDIQSSSGNQNNVLSYQVLAKQIKCIAIATDTPLQLSSISKDDIQRAAAMWILKTRELHRIPQSVMDVMIADIQGLFQLTISERIKTALTDANIDNCISESILSNFKEEQHIQWTSISSPSA